MPTVYIVNRSSHDYSAAEKYGELVYVTQGVLDVFAANNHSRHWMYALKDSKPEDYILLSSLNIVCSIGCSIFAMMHGRLNLLMYRKGKYVSKDLYLTDLLRAEEIKPTWMEKTDDQTNSV